MFAITLPKIGINVRFVDNNDPEQFKAAITDKTKAIFVEIIGNPKMDVADLEVIANIAHEAGIPLIVITLLLLRTCANPSNMGRIL